MPLNDREFNIIKVIDNRTQRENLGIAQKGMSNKKVAAVFPEDFESYLTNTLEAALPSKTEKRPLIIKVDRLHISERTMATKEIGTCDVSLEFFEEIDGKLYSLGKFKSLIEESSVDVTKRHGNRIMQALETCLLEFNQSDWQLADKKLHLEDPKLLDHPQSQLVFDFNSPPAKGLYLHFDNWLNQTPHETDGFSIKPINENGKIPRYQVLDERKKKIKFIYGFSDGASFYLQASNYLTGGNYFVKSDLIGPYLLFKDQISDPTMAVAFGAIGALASTKTIHIVLNMQNGMITFLNKANMADLLSDHPELLSIHENSKKSLEQEKEIIRLLNEKLLSEPRSQQLSESMF
ncbi:hypothetical protein [Pararhodonellum marinum]|uniref:hypothetical protein n=1 Tax=Pararhodonellum marinum TaxID=2755358 RepID=UPI00188EA485|nr:hypothetical protein [Pararhodonellum marinum]